MHKPDGKGAHRPGYRAIAAAWLAVLATAAAGQAEPPSPAPPHAPVATMNLDLPGSALKAPPPEAAAPAKNPGENPGQPLDGVTIYGKRDAFAASDKKLKATIDGLPCVGCDGKTARPTLAEKAFNLGVGAVKGFLPTDPDKVAPKNPESNSDAPEDRANVLSQQGTLTPANPFGGVVTSNMPTQPH